MIMDHASLPSAPKFSGVVLQQQLLVMMPIALLLLCSGCALAIADTSVSSSRMLKDIMAPTTLDHRTTGVRPLPRIPERRLRGNLEREGEDGSLRLQRRRLLQGDISPPGLWPDSDDDENELSMHSGKRSLLGDISPPGMWPPTDGQDAAPVVQEKLFASRRYLLTGKAGSTALPSERDVTNSFGTFLRRVLLNAESYSLVTLRKELSERVTVHKQVRTVQDRTLQAKNSFPSNGEMRADPDIKGSQRFQAENFRGRDIQEGDISLESKMGQDVFRDDHEAGQRSTLSDLKGTSISSLGMWQMSNDEESLKRRALLADISPPGMWSDDDDDNSESFASGAF